MKTLVAQHRAILRNPINSNDRKKINTDIRRMDFFCLEKKNDLNV